VPYAAGGATDVVVRVFAGHLQTLWQIPVIVDNRPGASGNIGAAAVAKSAPDGQTLLAGVSSMAAVSALFRHLSYDPLVELQPISGMTFSPSLLVVNPDVPARNIKELVALAKARPGQLNYGSTGIGSGGQLAFEYFNSLAGIDFTHIPYQGDAPLMPALLSNQVQAAILQPPAASPLLKSGRLRALAVTTARRFALMPDIPTMTESGLQGYEYVSWTGLFAPAGTSPEVIEKIARDVAQVARLEEMTSRQFPAWNVEPYPATSEAFKAQYVGDVAKYKQIVRTAGIQQID